MKCVLYCQGPSQSHLVKGSIEDEIPYQEQSLTVHSLHLAQASFLAGWPEKGRHIPVLTLLPRSILACKKWCFDIKRKSFPDIVPCGFIFFFFTFMIILSLAMVRRNNFFSHYTTDHSLLGRGPQPPGTNAYWLLI